MRFSLFLILTSLLVNLQAQIVNPKKVRFGKFSDKELALKIYSPDPEADAVILFDEGLACMGYDVSTSGFELIIERHQRVKILKSTGTDYANFIFRLYNSTNSSSKEEITSIKGLTINMVSGEAVETKLTKEGIFKESISDGLDQLSITFPQVKEGSIIDLKYTYKSDFIASIPTWHFQRSIPTDYSFYEAIFPEYFYYSVDMQGFATDHLVENTVAEPGTSNLTIPGGRTGSQKLDFSTRGYRWSAKEVPSLKSEPFSPTVSNYFFRVNFELASVNFPGRLGTNYSLSWDDIASFYRKFSGNRPYTTPRKEIEALVTTWISEASTEAERLVSIYEATKKRLQWNSTYDLAATKTPSQLLELNTGSSADLNFFLLSALKVAGIEVYPVLVSTRNNGYLSLTRPSLQQFNHVIVAAILTDGQTVLLDATRPDIPLPLLAKANLNDRGRIIKEETSEWVDLRAPAEHETALQLQLKLQADGQLTGTAKYKASGYAGLDIRRELSEASELEQYLEKWTGQSLSELEVSGFDNHYEDLSVSAQIDASASVMNNDELYYLSAIMATHYAENPLVSDVRLFPVDLQTPQDYVYVLQLELEEGIKIAEIPESINVALPDGKGRYSLRFIELNGNLQIIEKLSVKEPFFYAQEYAALKNFFDLVIEQQQATVVLQKE